MSQNDDSVDTVTAAEEGAKAGLPVAVRDCPGCGQRRKAQQLVDFPDDPETAPTPYSCLTCGCEFAV